MSQLIDVKMGLKFRFKLRPIIANNDNKCLNVCKTVSIIDSVIEKYRLLYVKFIHCVID